MGKRESRIELLKPQQPLDKALYRNISSSKNKKEKEKWQYQRKEQDIQHKDTEEVTGRHQNLKLLNALTAVQQHKLILYAQHAELTKDNL